MRAVTERVLITGYGEWEIDGKPITRKDGSHVEYVQGVDLDTNEGFQWTLSADVSGPRPGALEMARLELELEKRSRGREDGSVTTKLGATVVGFPVAGSNGNGADAAEAAKKSAQPAKS